MTSVRVNRRWDERRNLVCYNQQLITYLMQKFDVLKRGHLTWLNIPVILA